ncbi:MAG TPA: tetratricopeptide repeat protein [Sphingomicrobium sp.]|nr:tetratricopeptide repeat protein [Sphingomicrobium sp.]
MIASLLIAAAVAAAPADPATLSDAARAIEAGRLEQARTMIGRAVAAGGGGPQIDRLLADLAFASGKDAEALPRYRQLLYAKDAHPLIAERAAIAALRLGDFQAAAPLVELAVAWPNASWRAWNAKGVLADLGSDWAAADEAYERATALAPDRPEILNNQGWSQLLRGNWRRAMEDFGRAADLDPRSKRIANNLELARAALARELPERRPGESDESWAGRLNDAGVAAQILGDRRRAIAAFSQALEASGRWYDRAANNLKAVGGK